MLESELMEHHAIRNCKEQVFEPDVRFETKTEMLISNLQKCEEGKKSRIQCLRSHTPQKSSTRFLSDGDKSPPFSTSSSNIMQFLFPLISGTYPIDLVYSISGSHESSPVK